MKNAIFENAQPIWICAEFGENEYAEFVQRIDFKGEKTSVRLSVCGDYTLFVNGTYAASNQYGDFAHYKIYDEIDITSYLKSGENTICFLVWYFGKTGMRYLTEKPGLVYEILSGDDVIASSGENTLSRKSLCYDSGFDRKISNQLGYSFAYDSTLEDDWLCGRGDGFGKSYVIDVPYTYFPRPVEKHIVEKPVYGNIIKTEKGFIADLGSEYVGLCTFAVVSDREQRINVAYGELLDGGHVKRKIGNRDFSFDYVASEGRNEYTHYMLRLACRYIEFEADFPIEPLYVGLMPTVYPVRERAVTLSDKLDADIYRICVNTLKLCMMEHYVDCPWREQCLYAFDSRNQILCGYTAFEDKNLDYARANLLLMSKDVKEDHIMSICYPSGLELTIPSFSLYYILSVKEYLEHSGDIAFAELVFDKLTNILNAFKLNMTDGLVCIFGEECRWNFYDWSDYCVGVFGTVEEEKPDFLINAIFVYALRSYDDICRRLGRENVFKGLAGAVSAKASDMFCNPYDGLYYIHSFDEKPTELANSLAVISGIASDNAAIKIVSKLADGSLMPCSLSMKVFKYDAMLSADADKYAQSIIDEIRATYEPMLHGGTDTVWETAEGSSAFDYAGSLCHGWSAIPVHYYILLEGKYV